MLGYVIVSERWTIDRSELFLWFSTAELQTERKFVRSSGIIRQRRYSYVITVTEFERALLESYQYNERIRVVETLTEPDTTHHKALGQVETIVQLLEILLMLVKNIG